MPRRWLAPEFFTDEKMKKAIVAERLLAAAIIANQDDDGRLKGDPAYLRSIAFLYDDYSLDEVRKMRDHLLQVNPNIILYENAGDEYIQLKRYKRYQKPRYYHASKFPAPQGWPFNEEPFRSDYKGDVERDIQYEIANKLKSGQWQPTNEEIINVEVNKRLGNLYADIFATTTSKTHILIEIKQYPLQFRDLGQIIDYRTEAEARGYMPITALLIGKGLGNLSLDEALSASVTPLILDLTPIQSVAPTRDHVTATTSDDVAPTIKPVRATMVTTGKGKNLDLDKSQDIRMPSASVAAGGVAGAEVRAQSKPKTRLKPRQQEAGIFLDMVEHHIGVSLVERPSLIGKIRNLLVKNPAATPEGLFECFTWLKVNDSFCRSRDSPTVLKTLPSKYPEWAAGKLAAPGGKEERYARAGEHRQHIESDRKPYEWEEAPDETDTS